MTADMKTGIVYHPDFLLHTNPHHPERKERLEAIMSLLARENLLTRLRQILPLPAALDEVTLVHTPQHLEYVRKMVERGSSYLDADTYLTKHSFDVALLSAGGALTAMRAVLGGELRTCFSLGRPPGHHAEPDNAMGFCLFNNGAIAARAAMKEFGVSKILFLDWDVHHGNGTQQCFYHCPEVLFVSIHQSPAYPGTGHLQETGAGHGLGYNVNIPLPPGCGDEEYEAAFREVIVPLAAAYRPEVVLVSSGHDTYHADPLAGMSLSFRGFAAMARYAREIAEMYCGGRTVLFLEGGYHLQGQAEAVVTILAELGQLERPLNEEEVCRGGAVFGDPRKVIAAAREHPLLRKLKND
jgi:acetoin utilization deacetylase AcuC-like enzyme